MLCKRTALSIKPIIPGVTERTDKGNKIFNNQYLKNSAFDVFVKLLLKPNMLYTNRDVL